MAIPKRGSSQIIVDSITYRWRVRNRPTYSQGNGWTNVKLAVAAEQKPSTTLIVNLERKYGANWLEIPSQPVVPSEVEQWIRNAKANGWTPLEAGKPFEMHESTRGKDETSAIGVNIRPATPADARAVAELLFSLTEYPSYRQHGLTDLEKRVATGLNVQTSHRSVLVAELEGVVMGYSVVHWFTPVITAPEGYVSDLFVHANAMGRGLGSSLLEALTTEARARGCKRLALSNWRNRTSYKRGFYTKRGWQENADSARFVLSLEGDA